MRLKHILISIVAMSIWVGAGSMPSALAIPFSDLVDFGPGNSTHTFTDSDPAATDWTAGGRSWTHDITDNIGGNLISNVTINNATLTFRYRNTNDTSEAWSLNQGLGALTLTGNSDVTTNFPLGAGALGDLQADGLIIFTVSESSATSHSFRAFEATLAGDYTVKTNNNGGNNGNSEAPEPTSAAIVGMGLVGFLTFLRRRRRTA